MRPFRVSLILAAMLLALVGCHTDPKVAIQRYMDRGNEFYKRGKYKEARILYLDARKKDLRYGPAYYHLALVSVKLGNLTDAVNFFRRAIELIPDSSPDHWDSIVKLSDIYVAVARDQKPYMDEVMNFCALLLKRDPNSYDGHRLQGDVNFVRSVEAVNTARKEDALTLLDASLEEYRKADSLKPNQQGVLIQMARALSAKHQFAEGEQLYRRVIDLDKTYRDAYLELYKLEILQGKIDDAERVLKLVIANNPKQYSYLQLLATHYSIQRRRDDMVAVLQQIKAHAKEFDQAYVMVGDFYLRTGDMDSAIREYREGMGKDPAHKNAYEKHIVEVYMRQGKRADASQIASQMLKDDPNDSFARGLEASFMLDTSTNNSQVRQAMGELQAVVAHSPDNFVALYNLGRAHARQNELEQARQMFERAIKIRPDYMAARLALAQLEVQRQEYDAALKTAQAILAIDRSNINAKLIESAAMMGEKKFAESRQLLDQMMKTNPGSPDVFFQIGVVNLDREAVAEFDRGRQDILIVERPSLLGIADAVASCRVHDYRSVVRSNNAEARASAALVALHLDCPPARGGHCCPGLQFPCPVRGDGSLATSRGSEQGRSSGVPLRTTSGSGW